MTRILITNFHPKGGGGHVPYIEALTKISDIDDHIIAVASPKKSRLYQLLKERKYERVFPCDFPAKVQKEFISVLKSILKFRRLVRSFKPDIVHVNGGADLFIALWSHPFLRKYKIVRTHHAIKNIKKDFYHRYIYRTRISHNIYVSQSAFKLCTKTGLKITNYSIINNGINLKEYSPSVKDDSLAKECNLQDGTFCFGSCAGTGHYKRVDLIIKAAILLKDIEKPFKILVFGESSSGKKLEKLAHSLGVEQFKYCGFQKNVTPYVHLFDFGFILSDSIETISFAAREMVACGKPLISSSFSGLKENIIEGKTGFFTNPGDIQSTAEAMRKALSLTQHQQEDFSINCRSYAISNFNIQTQINSHIEMYRNVTDPKDPYLSDII